MRCFLLFIMINITACSHPETFPTGTVIDTVRCKADTTQSYALYIPAQHTGAVIYCFDPHGAGVLPLNNYRTLADKYGFILVGSNNSKNGNNWQVTDLIWKTLAQDTKERLQLDTGHLYTCGFSGGAKVAGYVALNYPGIRSVIVNGAGLPDEVAPANFHFSYTTLAGEGDLNFTDLLAFNNALDTTTTRHHLILYEGKHEWAPVTAMDIAFAGIQADDGHAPKDFVSQSTLRLDADMSANQLLKAEAEYRLILSYLNNEHNFKDRLNSLLNDPLYKKQYNEQVAVLVREQQAKEQYIEKIMTPDTAYWPRTIRELNTGARLPSYEGAMHQRLLAYLSLLFYTFSNHNMVSHNDAVARYFVKLYQQADPANSEAYYFSAVLYARAGNKDDAEKELQQAVKYGFNDHTRFLEQPEFQGLTLDVSF